MVNNIAFILPSAACPLKIMKMCKRIAYSLIDNTKNKNPQIIECEIYIKS